MPAKRPVVTVRFDENVLELARRHADLSNPSISLNTAINLLVAAGAQVTEPNRLSELRTLTDAVNLIEKLAKRLDTDGPDG